MTSLIKYTFPHLLLTLLTSCAPNSPTATQTQLQVKEQINAHYDSLQLEGYQPLYYSAMDTIAIERNKNGEVWAIIGKVTHRHQVLQGDSVKEQSQIFDVQVYEDGEDVIVFPAKPNIKFKEIPLIRI